VGDIAAMLTLAMSVGFGVTGIMLYMFTNENLNQYAVLKAMGATSRQLLGMIFVQAGLCALLGSGLGLGLCGMIGQIAPEAGYPFRMMLVHAVTRRRDGCAGKYRGRGNQCPSRVEARTRRGLRGALVG
jgi:ABC-type antimicrobial peptide transport system permease subunit